MKKVIARRRLVGAGLGVALLVSAVAVLAGFASSAKAFPGQTIFVTTTPGVNNCPLPFLGGFSIRQVGPDNGVNSAPDGFPTENDGQVSFTAAGGPLTHLHVATSWSTWSNDYGWGNGGPAEFCNNGPAPPPPLLAGTGVVTNPAGDVYATTPDDFGTIFDQADIWLPFQTQAFQFYVEPNDFTTYNITGYDQTGQATATVPVNGDAGAQYFGFWTVGGPYTMRHIHVQCVPDCGGDGFAIGEFGLHLQKLARAS